MQMSCDGPSTAGRMSATVQRTPSICDLRLERDVGSEHQAQPSRPPGQQNDVVDDAFVRRRGRRRRRCYPVSRYSAPVAGPLARTTLDRCPGGGVQYGALQAVDLDHDAVIELEEAQLPESDLGQHPRGGDVLDPAAADQLVAGRSVRRPRRGSRVAASVAMPCRQRSGRTK